MLLRHLLTTSNPNLLPTKDNTGSNTVNSSTISNGSSTTVNNSSNINGYTSSQLAPINHTATGSGSMMNIPMNNNFYYNTYNNASHNGNSAQSANNNSSYFYSANIDNTSTNVAQSPNVYMNIPQSPLQQPHQPPPLLSNLSKNHASTPPPHHHHLLPHSAHPSAHHFPHPVPGSVLSLPLSNFSHLYNNCINATGNHQQLIVQQQQNLNIINDNPSHLHSAPSSSTSPSFSSAVMKYMPNNVPESIQSPSQQQQQPPPQQRHHHGYASIVQPNSLISSTNSYSNETNDTSSIYSSTFAVLCNDGTMLDWNSQMNNNFTSQTNSINNMLTYDQYNLPYYYMNDDKQQKQREMSVSNVSHYLVPAVRPTPNQQSELSYQNISEHIQQNPSFNMDSTDPSTSSYSAMAAAPPLSPTVTEISGAPPKPQRSHSTTSTVNKSLDPVCPKCEKYITSYKGNMQRHMKTCGRSARPKKCALNKTSKGKDAAAVLGLSSLDPEKPAIYMAGLNSDALCDGYQPNVALSTFSSSSVEEKNLSGNYDAPHGSSSVYDIPLRKPDPFVCSLCGFKTIYKGNMKRHLLACHDLKETDMKDGSIDSLRTSRNGAICGSPASRNTDTPQSFDDKRPCSEQSNVSSPFIQQNTTDSCSSFVSNESTGSRTSIYVMQDGGSHSQESTNVDQVENEAVEGNSSEKKEIGFLNDMAPNEEHCHGFKRKGSSSLETYSSSSMRRTKRIIHSEDDSPNYMEPKMLNVMYQSELDKSGFEEAGSV